MSYLFTYGPTMYNVIKIWGSDRKNENKNYLNELNELECCEVS